jgi:tetratricopeptide (TPR) repeat protein
MMSCCAGIFFMLFSTLSYGQAGLSYEIKKPKQYENRTLPAEKTGNSKFTAPKRFYNDLVSRFNYYFNANTKLNGLIDSAKGLHKDDYTQLLSFYNYSLDQTAMGEIDTIIYKCTAGILLHDLRSDWVDKLYLLMGKAYLYRKNFDSASTVFQYINYAFAAKDNGYDIPIGSNASNTNGIFTIATREKQSVWKKLMSFPPSRNESFIWQARTYIEKDQLVEAGSLLELIRSDPNFPPRLKNDLEELTAYNLYKQEQYSTGADHLLKALGNAANSLEKARWEFLAGQMYERARKDSQAIVQYERSIQHTSDPLMEVYARLNIVSLAAGRKEDALQKNLDELLKMAKRDKYEANRDIIYYAAAELELKRKNYAAAQALLLKSVKYSVSNPEQKNKSFLLLGDMNYTRKAYGYAYHFYDSIQIPLLKEIDQQRVTERKPALKIISGNQDIITREDSLLKLSLLPEEERLALVKKMLKQLRKEKGLKDVGNDPVSFGNTLSSGSASAPVDLFGSSMSEFYFLNNSLKAKGLGDFKSKWGNRPNVDNWRRQTAVNTALTTAATASSPNDKKTLGAPTKEPVQDLSLNSLTKDIPLTPAQKDSSNSAIKRALLNNALAFQNMLEDFPSAIEMYEELVRRFPESAEVEPSLFNLVYCYKKDGQQGKSDSVANILKTSFATGKFAEKLNNNAVVKTDKKNDPAEKQYADIYNMFIAGKFEEAKEAKQLADKLHGKTYWTPQLLYIESIYYIKQKDDSTAINRLQNIVTLFGKSPLAEKANTMIDVLKRRSQIENYLTNLTIERPIEMVERGVDLNSTNAQAANNNKKDTSLNIPGKIQSGPKDLADLSNTKTISTAAVIKKDSVSSMPKMPMNRLDISNAIKGAAVNDNNYLFNAADTQYVVVVLDKVDPIFISEGRNAFNRYNSEAYSGSQRVDISTRKVNAQYQFLMIGPFANAREAITYIDRTKPLAKSRIIPWLTTDKYSFSMISNYNMRILVSKEDVEGYHLFIQQVFPDKF